MPAIVRLGDLGSGHGCWPARINDSASPDVYADGIKVHRLGDHWIPHTCEADTHDGYLSTASTTVFANGIAVGRVGDAISCGSTCAQGSSTVFAG